MESKSKLLGAAVALTLGVGSLTYAQELPAAGQNSQGNGANQGINVPQDKQNLPGDNQGVNKGIGDNNSKSAVGNGGAKQNTTEVKGKHRKHKGKHVGHGNKRGRRHGGRKTHRAA